MSLLKTFLWESVGDVGESNIFGKRQVCLPLH